MNSTTHVVLGGNGVAGRETVRALVDAGRETVSVGRRGSTVDGAVSATADLLDASDVARVLDGADVAYLVAGLPYSTKVWSQQFPVLLQNTIDAALAHGTRLVYLDNVYAYGRVDRPMTEQTPIHPSSRKGEVRAGMLAALDAARARGLEVAIGRSADFYGPGATTSTFNMFGLTPVARGEAGTWLLNADLPHSLTYTPDIGRALATLGSETAAFGHAWHLPSAPALTGREYLQIAGAPRVKVMSGTVLRLGSLFNSAARETLEMTYQFEQPYVFDSDAVERAFGLAPTPVDEGIAASLAAA